MSTRRLFASEDEFVAWLKRRARGRAAGVRLGVGDDAALIDLGRNQQMIVTSDLSVEGVHFSRHLHPPDAVGHRALARSLSDIAAMGGTPRFALVSLQLSKGVSRTWVESFYTGMLRLAHRFGVVMVGGDTAISPAGVATDVVVMGTVERGEALLRSGARSGDSLFVAGTLGLSALGLRRLGNRSARRYAGAVRAHLYPVPQCALGQFLSGRRLASAAIDISDGFSTDLHRLLSASRAGGRVWEDRIPTPKNADAGRSAISLALDGGEDYKLLFAASPRKVRRVPPVFKGVRIYQVGIVCEAGKGVAIEGPGGSRPLRPGGYDHFGKRW